VTPPWPVGRATIDQLLGEGKLTRVTANRPLADDYLRQARQHVASAALLATSDPEGAFQLAYDAARKSLAAVLVNQGLRASGMGAHATTYESVRAQLGQATPSVFQQFTWMRKLRNTTEYPDVGEKPADGADADDAIGFAASFIEIVEKLLDEMPPF
jgi:HEPN domain-containing protein